jgi:hypothetical protein
MIVALAFAAPASAGDDLALPPDLRNSAAPPPAAPPHAAPSPKQTKPQSAKQHAERPKPSSVAAPVPPPPTSTTEVVRPKSKTAEDPLSFGMKWNATNDPNFGPSTSSLLNEYHHDLTGQPTGAGGQIGLKYKF